jgi:hypothetical protein
VLGNLRVTILQASRTFGPNKESTLVGIVAIGTAALNLNERESVPENSIGSHDSIDIFAAVINGPPRGDFKGARIAWRISGQDRK